MLKAAKAKAKAGSAGRTSSHDAMADLPKSVLESSRQIWLAGLGAFSKAQAGGMKVFESLVQQGEVLEKKTRHVAADAAAAARGAAKAKAKEVQAMAGGTWDKLEQVFEDRVSRSLNRLGVLSSKDVEDLARQVAELNQSVRDLMGGSAPKAGRKAPAKKATRKRKAAK